MAGPDDRVVPAMRDMLDAARLVKAAYGAPGEHGYGTREGDALFALYRAAVALANALDDLEAA